jgi:hypothetical protein
MFTPAFFRFSVWLSFKSFYGQNSICVSRRLPFGMLHRVVSYILTDVSDELTAFTTLVMVAVSLSETSVSIYCTVRCNVSEDSSFHTVAVVTKLHASR